LSYLFSAAYTVLHGRHSQLPIPLKFSIILVVRLGWEHSRLQLGHLSFSYRLYFLSPYRVLDGNFISQMLCGTSFRWFVILLALTKAVIIYRFYEETMGKTLEAIDEVFDGVRHTQVNVDVYAEFARK
jgi:hypothetical protein